MNVSAVTFPGQGSQSAGMGRPWRDTPAWDQVIAELACGTDLNVPRLLLDASDEDLSDTANAQMAIFATSLLAWNAARDAGLAPAFFAGHSLGEYTALAAAGFVSITDAARLIDQRGEAMRLACAQNPGTMAVLLGTSGESVDQACAEVREMLSEEVWVANYNGDSQTVVAGTEAGVAHVEKFADRIGAKHVTRIPVAGAFHTPLMRPAAEQLSGALAQAEWLPSDATVVANVDASLHQAGSEWITLLSQQLVSPVRWTSVLKTFAANGVTHVVEIGHGNTLTGIAKRSGLGMKPMSFSSPTALGKIAAVLPAAEPSAAGSSPG